MIDEEGYEYCNECRHPVIWHSHAERPGVCCDCQLHRDRPLSPAYSHQRDVS